MAYSANTNPIGLDALTTLAADDAIVVGDNSDSDRAKKIVKANLATELAAETKTLTNTTYDADGSGNSLSNVEDANIKAGAAIDASKISAGDVSNTEFDYLDGVTSAIQTQLNAKGTGTVDTSGTPVDNDYAKFTDANTVEGRSYAEVKADLDLEIGTDVLAQQTIGIADDNLVETDSSSIADDEYARFTANGLESRSVAEVLSDIGALPLAGGTMTGDIQLGETEIKLDAALSGDETWSGITIPGTLGATIAVGDLCYLNADDSRWELVDANLSDGYDKQLGIVLVAGDDGDPTTLLVYGKVRSASFPAFTVGSPLYMSETAGDMTHTAPTTTDNAIRKVGIAITAEDLLFNPSNDYITHT